MSVKVEIWERRRVGEDTWTLIEKDPHTCDECVVHTSGDRWWCIANGDHIRRRLAPLRVRVERYTEGEWEFQYFLPSWPTDVGTPADGYEPPSVSFLGKSGGWTYYVVGDGCEPIRAKQEVDTTGV